MDGIADYSIISGLQTTYIQRSTTPLNHPICCICQCKFLNNRISRRKCIRLLRSHVGRTLAIAIGPSSDGVTAHTRCPVLPSFPPSLLPSFPCPTRPGDDARYQFRCLSRLMEPQHSEQRSESSTLPPPSFLPFFFSLRPPLWPGSLHSSPSIPPSLLPVTVCRTESTHSFPLGPANLCSAPCSHGVPVPVCLAVPIPRLSLPPSLLSNVLCFR